MQKKISIGATIVVVLLCCVVTFQTTFIVLQNKYEQKYLETAVHAVNPDPSHQPSEEPDPNSGTDGIYVEGPSAEFLSKVVDKLSMVDYIYRSLYIGEMDDETLIDGILSGYVTATGDDFGAYYNAEAFKEFTNDMDGELVGIGVNVIYNPDFRAIEILSVIPDSPALQAGVEPGDIIYTVGEDRVPVAELGYYPAINQLRGEVGTQAIFTVLRGEDYTEEVTFRIRRDKVTEITVMEHKYALDPTVGVIKITGFDHKTTTQFVNAVEKLVSEGCTSFVVDLRYNPGGELSSIVATLDYILPEGPIIRIMDKDGNQVDAYYSEATELNVPMAVLVNGSTASAAELFTAAVRDYGKAVIVGTTTYGKGTMQTTIPLGDDSAVSVTYRMYNPPFSDNYNGIGIVPDVVVELDEALAEKNYHKITDEEDNQLAAAVKALAERQANP